MLKRRTRLAVITALWIGVSLAARGTEEAPAIPLPEDYRGWFHVKSGMIDPGHKAYARFGGLHHIYANPLALTGYGAGSFPDGSVLVFDLLELRTGEDHTTSEGPRRHIDVMVKDKQRYKDTGGWGFEEFLPGSGKGTLSPAAARACHSCHITRKDHDGVFSTIRP
jgi:hypothetical protein